MFKKVSTILLFVLLIIKFDLAQGGQINVELESSGFVSSDISDANISNDDFADALMYAYYDVRDNINYFNAVSVINTVTTTMPTLVEPGHTLIKLVDSFAPLDPSHVLLDQGCIFGNQGNIESIGIDPATGMLYVQLIDIRAIPGSNTTCILSVSPAPPHTVTMINPNTGFGINARGTDLHYDPITSLLLTQDQNSVPMRIATQVPAPLGPTGTYSFVSPGLFSVDTFGMDFSLGVGDVPVGDIVFTSDVGGNGIHSAFFGGPVEMTHTIPPVAGDDMVIQPNGDWVHIPDFAGVIISYSSMPPHTATPSPTGLNLQGMYMGVGLPFTCGSRATVCDTTGDFYVSNSCFPGGAAMFRVDPTLTTATHVMTINAPEGLHDLILGPSTSGIGNSVYFTVHDNAIAGEEVWEVTVPECVEGIDVDKDYTYTDVCFEKDNDMDGEFSEDPMDFDPVGLPIDNDGDGLFNEDDTECPDGTNLGTLLPTTDQPDGVERFMVEAVLKKNGTVSSYNPGQYYAVSTIEVLSDINELTIWEDYSDCVDKNLTALNPLKGGGSVVIVMVGPDGVARQIMDAKSPNVTLVDGEAEAVIDGYDYIPAGTTFLMYVKFKPGLKPTGPYYQANLFKIKQKGQTIPPFPLNVCENENAAEAQIGDITVSESATAELMVQPKPTGPYYQANLFNIEQNNFYKVIYVKLVSWIDKLLNLGS
jgi:hypothetical protein